LTSSVWAPSSNLTLEAGHLKLIALEAGTIYETPPYVLDVNPEWQVYAILLSNNQKTGISDVTIKPPSP